MFFEFHYENIVVISIYFFKLFYIELFFIYILFISRNGDRKWLILALNERRLSQIFFKYIMEY